MQWLMLQQEKPEDFVISTGKMYTVRKFIELCSVELGWNKNKSSGIIRAGKDEIGKRADTGEIVIRIDPRYFRPTEVDELLGDSSKARKKLKWEPKISIAELISEMIEEDSKESQKKLYLRTKVFLFTLPKNSNFKLMNIIPIILAGGTGSRLWPLSRKVPETVFAIDRFENDTLLQKTYKRIADLENLSKPIIICHEEHRFIVGDQMRKIKIEPQAILLEPARRNTAPAITIAALKAIKDFKVKRKIQYF